MIGIGYFSLAVSTEHSAARSTLLPGKTTHGHYQIELDCAACHTRFLGVKQDACIECHGADLEREKDTHPASKFNDPTNAMRLAKLDAQNCISCHREHVPDRTSGMGLSLPKDYCFHCHQDVAEQRPSHQGMAHDTCATTGCHNYHDNRALYENFLKSHVDEPSMLEDPRVLLRKKFAKDAPQQLTREDADAPHDLLLPPIVKDWVETAHAAAGVNCRDCHDVTSADEKVRQWWNQVDEQACSECHQDQVTGFLKGRHGMRIAQGMNPMEPSAARLPMHADAAHRQLDCSACHQSHRFDTQFAAVEACMGCHDDRHTNNYLASRHYELWKEEMSGVGEAGTGVSCATCHLPRVEVDDKVQVEHNQNQNLRPREKMVRSVCMSCHGLEFSLSSLADSLLVDRCFNGEPSKRVESVEMAKRWFEEREKKRQRRRNN